MKSPKPLTRFVCLGLLLASFAALTARCGAQTWLIDFGAAANTTEHAASPDDPNNYWNNVTDAIGTSATGQLLNMVTIQNAVTPVSLRMVSRFGGQNGNGTTASTVYPSEATRDSLYGNTEAFNGLSNLTPIFRLTGLDTQTVYTLTFYASRTGVSDNRETLYTVAGATTNTATLNAANNVNNTAQAAGLRPTAAGEIVVSLAPSANNNNANHFTYLGVLKIDGVSSVPVTFVSQPTNMTVTEFMSVTFSATVAGPLPYFVQWYSNATPIPGATALSYTIPSVNLNMDGTQFSVSVSNLTSGAMSSNATLRVAPDVTPPTLVSVTCLDGLVIDVVFSERMEQYSSTEPLSYSINGGAVYMIGAALQPDGRTVRLTLETKISGTFNVAVDTVQDLAGNRIVATNLSGIVPNPDLQSVLIDFGGGVTTSKGDAPNDPVNAWNNVNATLGGTTGGQLPGLVTTQNLATPINLVIVSRFNAANENGTQTGAPFPGNASRDSLYGNTEAFNTLENIFPQLQLTGLKSNMAYTLTFYASRTGVTDNRENGYAATGATSGYATLNVANNVTNVAVVRSIRPTEAGEINISITATTNNNNANHFTYLGVLRIDPELSAPTFLPPGVTNGQIVLQWSGAVQVQWAPTVNGPWTNATPTTPNSLSEPLDLQTNRFFRLISP